MTENISKQDEEQREKNLAFGEPSIFQVVYNNQIKNHYSLEQSSVKRYWLFIYDMHQPHGGLHDLYATFDTLVEAREYFDNKERRRRNPDQLCHVFDSKEHFMIDIGRDLGWLKVKSSVL